MRNKPFKFYSTTAGYVLFSPALVRIFVFGEKLDLSAPSGKTFARGEYAKLCRMLDRVSAKQRKQK